MHNQLYIYIHFCNILKISELHMSCEEVPDPDARSASSLIKNWHFSTIELTVLH